jgi:transposase-like protein
MTQEPLSSKLTGIVEIDETNVGGKFRTGPHAIRQGQRPQDRLVGTENKAIVVSVLQRGGRVQSRHIDKVTAKNLRPMIDQMLAEDAQVMSDTPATLKTVGMTRKLSQVNHNRKEYVRREKGVTITTNTVEGYFANLKRGLNGVYRHVGKQHLHRYLSEFDFRYNARKIKDGERTLLAIKGVSGKRLRLRDSRNEVQNDDIR